MPVSRLSCILLYVTLLVPLGVRADIPLDENGEWNVFGRFRLRFEQDNDENPFRPERSRVRVGNYAGIRFTPNKDWTFVARARAGDRRDARILDASVLTDNDYFLGQRGIFIDQYYASYQFESDSDLTVGRSTLPFWSNTEKLWDEDLTPVGAHFRTLLGNGKNPLMLVAGTFHMPDGMEYFHTWMHAAQLHWIQTGNQWNWEWGFLSMIAMEILARGIYCPVRREGII